MKEPARRLKRSLFKGSFSEETSVFGKKQVGIEVEYDNQCATGSLKITVPGVSYDLLKGLCYVAASSCRMVDSVQGVSGSAWDHQPATGCTMEIHPLRGVNSDRRVRKIIRTFLDHFGVPKNPTSFTMKILREYELRVPAADGSGMVWISEGMSMVIGFLRNE
jgi:hypothetical protein